MPLSFWITLFVCLISFLPSLLDHGQGLREFRSTHGKAKFRYILKLSLMWAIPAFALLATVISGIEAVATNAESSRRRLEISQATNALAKARVSIAQMEKQTAWKTIPPENRGKFVSAIRRIPKSEKLSIQCQAQDARSVSYAQEIKRCFQSAGYNVAGPDMQMVVVKITGRQDVTVLLFVKDVSQPPSVALPVQQAFSIIGERAPVHKCPRKWIRGFDELMIWVGPATM